MICESDYQKLVEMQQPPLSLSFWDALFSLRDGSDSTDGEQKWSGDTEQYHDGVNEMSCMVVEFERSDDGNSLVKQIMFYSPCDVILCISDTAALRDLCCTPVPELLNQMRMHDAAIHEHVGPIDSDVLVITRYDRFKPIPISPQLGEKEEEEKEEGEEETWDPVYGVHNRRHGMNRHVYWAGLFRSLGDTQATGASLSQSSRDGCVAWPDRGGTHSSKSSVIDKCHSHIPSAVHDQYGG